MKPWPKFVPTFEPVLSTDGLKPHPTIEISAPHMAVEPWGQNHVRITIAGITKTVDGVSLCNAVNEALAAKRHART